MTKLKIYYKDEILDTVTNDSLIDSIKTFFNIEDDETEYHLLTIKDLRGYFSLVDIISINVNKVNFQIGE